MDITGRRSEVTRDIFKPYDKSVTEDRVSSSSKTNSVPKLWKVNIKSPHWEKNGKGNKRRFLTFSANIGQRQRSISGQMDVAWLKEITTQQLGTVSWLLVHGYLDGGYIRGTAMTEWKISKWRLIGEVRSEHPPWRMDSEMENKNTLQHEGEKNKLMKCIITRGRTAE